MPYQRANPNRFFSEGYGWLTVIALFVAKVILSFTPQASEAQPEFELIKPATIIDLRKLTRPPKPSSKAYFPTHEGPLQETIIVLDPGHGGCDPGAANLEAAITYRATWQLSQILQDKGALVYLTTRSHEMSEPLFQHKTGGVLPIDAVYGCGPLEGQPIKQSWPCGLLDRLKGVESVRKYHQTQAKNMIFLSLHVDSIEGTAYSRGACVYTQIGRWCELSQHIAKAIKAKGYGRRSQAQEEVQRQANLGILRDNPLTQCVLIELGVIQSESDCQILLSKAGRADLLNTIAQSIVGCVKSLEKGKKDQRDDLWVNFYRSSQSKIYL